MILRAVFRKPPVGYKVLKYQHLRKLSRSMLIVFWEQAWRGGPGRVFRLGEKIR